MVGTGRSRRSALPSGKHQRSLHPASSLALSKKMIDDLEYRRLIEAEARYQKELEIPYEGAEQILRMLSSRYRIGIIANQSTGTEERLAKWGLMPFVSICLSFAEVGLEKPDPAIFQLALS